MVSWVSVLFAPRERAAGREINGQEDSPFPDCRLTFAAAEDRPGFMPIGIPALPGRWQMSNGESQMENELYVGFEVH
jgi:hypothetical protein